MRRLVPLVLALLLATPALADVAPLPCDTPEVTPAPQPELTLRNGIWLGDELMIGGTPTGPELAAFADAGFLTVIDLRAPQEDGVAWEKDYVPTLGMEYVSLPIAGKAGVTEDAARALRIALIEAEAPVLLHCASGNRVGALFAIAMAKMDGVDPEMAIEAGKLAGMTRLEPVVRELLGVPAKDAPKDEPKPADDAKPKDGAKSADEASTDPEPKKKE
jgi:uncharacterized protein (TIGR01244 family)